MIEPKDLADAFARNVEIIRRQTKGLTHADSLLQLPFRGNCLNWVLGHIAVHRDDLLQLLGEPPVLGAAGERYARGSESLSAAEPGVLSLAELIASLERSQERLHAVLTPLADADTAREITLRDRTLTLGRRLFFYYFHETYHLGQTEFLRQLAGVDDRVI